MPRNRKPKAPPTPSTNLSQASPTPSNHDPTTNSPLTIPANWPPHLTYLTTPIYSPNLTPLELSALHKPPISILSDPPPPLPNPPYPHISIQPIHSPSTHPALHQNGLFATRRLSPSSFICDYMGYIHPTPSSSLPSNSNPVDTVLVAESGVDEDADINTASLDSSLIDQAPAATGLDLDAAAASSDYDLSLLRELRIGIDSSTCGNEARFINDYRSIRSFPNAQFEEHWVKLPSAEQPPHEALSGTHTEDGRIGKQWKWELRMGVFVAGMRRDGKGVGKRGIVEGEEVVVSYGKGFWKERVSEKGNDHEEDDNEILTSGHGEAIEEGESR